MTESTSGLEGIPRIGRVALVDFASAPNPEAGLAFTSVTRDIAEKSSGRLRWAGHVDQQFIGTSSQNVSEIVISEFPAREQAIRALAERGAWGTESFMGRHTTFVVTPGSAMLRVLSGARDRCLWWIAGGGAAMDLSDPSALAGLAERNEQRSLAPTAGQLNQLASCGIEGKVVLFSLSRLKREGASTQSGGRSSTSGSIEGSTAKPSWRFGGERRFDGTRARCINDPNGGAWDMLTAIQYPSRAAFLGRLASSVGVDDAAADRDGELEAAQAFVCTSHAEFF